MHSDDLFDLLCAKRNELFKAAMDAPAGSPEALQAVTKHGLICELILELLDQRAAERKASAT
jgi:hypothetical protein